MTTSEYRYVDKHGSKYRVRVNGQTYGTRHPSAERAADWADRIILMLEEDGRIEIGSKELNFPERYAPVEERKEGDFERQYNSDQIIIGLPASVIEPWVRIVQSFADTLKYALENSPRNALQTNSPNSSSENSPNGSSNGSRKNSLHNSDGEDVYANPRYNLVGKIEETPEPVPTAPYTLKDKFDDFFVAALEFGYLTETQLKALRKIAAKGMGYVGNKALEDAYLDDILSDDELRLLKAMWKNGNDSLWEDESAWDFTKVNLHV